MHTIDYLKPLMLALIFEYALWVSSIFTSTHITTVINNIKLLLQVVLSLCKNGKGNII